jgi:hypothetical protein
MIGAQAALVSVLIVGLYFWLLRPSSIAPLTGAGVPGQPQHGHQHPQRRHAGGHGHHRHQGRGSQQGAAVPFAQNLNQPGAPSGPATSPLTPIGPNEDQYLGTVAALDAKLGIDVVETR